MESDIHEWLRDFQLRSERSMCGATTRRRGHVWCCARPKEHDGDHAQMDIRLRYWGGEGPLAKTETQTRMSVRDYELGLARQEELANQGSGR